MVDVILIRVPESQFIYLFIHLFCLLFRQLCSNSAFDNIVYLKPLLYVRSAGAHSLGIHVVYNDVLYVVEPLLPPNRRLS